LASGGSYILTRVFLHFTYCGLELFIPLCFFNYGRKFAGGWNKVMLGALARGSRMLHIMPFQGTFSATAFPASVALVAIEVS